MHLPFRLHNWPVSITCMATLPILEMERTSLQNDLRVGIACSSKVDSG